MRTKVNGEAVQSYVQQTAEGRLDRETGEMNVGQIFALSRETRDALATAQNLIARLTAGGVGNPSVLVHLVEPSLRLRDRLEIDTAVLEKAVVDLGL